MSVLWHACISKCVREGEKGGTASVPAGIDCPPHPSDLVKKKKKGDDDEAIHAGPTLVCTRLVRCYIPTYLPTFVR